MKRLLLWICLILVPTVVVHAQAKPWVSAYYAGWMQSYLPPSAIDFGAMTHIIHFSLEPSGTSGVSGTGNGITPAASRAIVQAAHAAGTKVLISCGGYGADQGFVTATKAANRTAFVNNLVSYVTTYGYDGVDIDWEPVTSPSQFKLFIPELRAALNAASPGLLLTIAVMMDDEAAIAPVQSSFDQINIMTYDISGAWPGWVVWHNSPIYDGGFKFPSTGALVPSCNGAVDQFVAAGIPKSKVGIGTDFYGYVWSGVTQPRQTWSTEPTVSGNIDYSDLMTTYAGVPAQWDSLAGAAYLKITTGGGKFVSFDNEQTMTAKAKFIRDKGIGGLIIWELGGGYRANQPAGQRDKLLQAVKQAFTVTDAPALAVPSEFQLKQNYPNPFNPSTTIGYTIASTGHEAMGTRRVKLAVYDMLGREVATLVDDQKSPGTYQVSFDGTGLSSGVYVYRLAANGTVATRTMTLLK
jgi:chitinase